MISVLTKHKVQRCLHNIVSAIYWRNVCSNQFAYVLFHGVHLIYIKHQLMTVLKIQNSIHCTKQLFLCIKTPRKHTGIYRPVNTRIYIKGYAYMSLKQYNTLRILCRKGAVVTSTCVCAKLLKDFITNVFIYGKGKNILFSIHIDSEREFFQPYEERFLVFEHVL